MRVLEELYYGNISPNERAFVKGGKFDKAMETAVKNEELLTELLCGAELDLFVNFRDAQSEINSITAVENFVCGFRVGARIGIEVMNENDGELVEIG